MNQPALLPDPTGTSDTQWIAESMQLVNWGGFHGHTLIELDPEATLLSGASGTGKSTILDGYLALIMPSDTPFNGASNDASGRARNPEQRNLLTYLRGKIDDSREAGTGALTDKVLRGIDGPTWGAISMTFADSTSRRLTALRAFHVPRGAVAFKDITMKMATLDGRLDLRELEPLAAAKFDKRALTTRWPSMFVANTYAEFAQRLFDRLGIGSGGNGTRALRLLARIQAGQHVRTVDGLYKAMVLEQPATYAAADSAAKHFDDLDRSYQEMQTAAEKQHTLATAATAVGRTRAGPRRREAHRHIRRWSPRRHALPVVAAAHPRPVARLRRARRAQVPQPARGTMPHRAHGTLPAQG